MFKPGFKSSTDAHLKAAQFNKTAINVWQQDELLDAGGQIEMITTGAVQINGEKYLKETCEFRVH